MKNTKENFSAADLIALTEKDWDQTWQEGVEMIQQIQEHFKYCKTCTTDFNDMNFKSFNQFERMLASTRLEDWICKL